SPFCPVRGLPPGLSDLPFSAPRLTVVAPNAQAATVAGVVGVQAKCDQFAAAARPVVCNDGGSVAQAAERLACEHTDAEALLMGPVVPPLPGGGTVPVVPVGLAPG